MIPLLLGSIVLVVLATSTAFRCAGTRSGIHPWVIAPALLVVAVLAFAPVGFWMGGDLAELAGWVWLVGALLLLPATKLVHEAIRGVQQMADFGESRIARFGTYDHPSIEKIASAQASLEGELMQCGIDVSPNQAERR